MVGPPNRLNIPMCRWCKKKPSIGGWCELFCSPECDWANHIRYILITNMRKELMPRFFMCKKTYLQQFWSENE